MNVPRVSTQMTKDSLSLTVFQERLSRQGQLAGQVNEQQEDPDPPCPHGLQAVE